MDKNLADPNLSPFTKQFISNSDLVMAQSPFRLLGLPPVMEAEHDGEGAGGQQLLVVDVVQAVGRCQGKSVANLEGEHLRS